MGELVFKQVRHRLDMSKNRFYTPEGVCDVLPEELANQRQIEKQLHTLFSSQGYQEVSTPSIEFLDVYQSGSFVPPEHLYKMTDPEGRLLCLRYDGTIPVARMAATVLKEQKLPLRLSYTSNMFRYKESGGGRQQEFCQSGIELLGVDSPQSDAEVIALAVESALTIGLTDLQISLGQSEFFRGLTQEWALASKDVEELALIIDLKDTVALEQQAKNLSLSDSRREILLAMLELFSPYDTLDFFQKRLTNPKSLQALENLRQILTFLEAYGYLKYITIDLGMIRSLDYYTGMIFKGYTYEVGFPIFSGGRYNNVVSSFGRDLAAVGFSLSVNLCLNALRRQGKCKTLPNTDVIIGYSSIELFPQAIEMAKSLRLQGLSVIVDSQGQKESELHYYAQIRQISQQIYLNPNTGCQL